MKIIYFFLLISLCFAQLDKPENKKAITKKSLFKKYMLNTLPAYLFFGPYSFMYGVTLGGSAISRGESPRMANAMWLSTPLLAGILVNYASNSTTTNILSKPSDEDYSSTFYYNIYYVGPDISSIKNIRFESLDSEWKANIDEVPSGFDYPPLGFRTGFFTEKYGIDYEMSLIAHHTTQKNVIYEYDSPETGIVPLPQNIPSHFYMMHSMFIGFNIYYVLPNFIFTPYVGIGGGGLLNSVQSEYPGPADLARQEGTLALDEMNWNYGAHTFLGFRLIKENLFYFIEIRPTVHKFELTSGSQNNKSKDKFNLESMQFQFGIGKSIFK